MITKPWFERVFFPFFFFFLVFTFSKVKLENIRLNIRFRGFPGGAEVKNPPANVGATGLSPGPGRSHMSWNS